MCPIFKTELLTYQLKDNLDEEFSFGKINHHPKIRKMLAKGLYGNQAFHLPFRSMIYLVLKFKVNAVFNVRNRTLSLIASASWTRVKSRIFVPIRVPYRHLPNFESQK